MAARGIQILITAQRESHTIELLFRQVAVVLEEDLERGSFIIDTRESRSLSKSL